MAVFVSDRLSIPISGNNFISSSLNEISNIRPLSLLLPTTLILEITADALLDCILSAWGLVSGPSLNSTALTYCLIP